MGLPESPADTRCWNHAPCTRAAQEWSLFPALRLRGLPGPSAPPHLLAGQLFQDPLQPWGAGHSSGHFPTSMWLFCPPDQLDTGLAQYGSPPRYSNGREAQGTSAFSCPLNPWLWPEGGLRPHVGPPVSLAPAFLHSCPGAIPTTSYPDFLHSKLITKLWVT